MIEIVNKIIIIASSWLFILLVYFLFGKSEGVAETWVHIRTQKYMLQRNIAYKASRLQTHLAVHIYEYVSMYTYKRNFKNMYMQNVCKIL